MKFEFYPIADKIKDNLEKLGFKRPTDIQHRAITPILNGEDVLGIAQTGTGKTAAFAIPIVNMAFEFKAKYERKNTKNEIFALVMAPTRELAIQITEVFETIAVGTNLKIANIVGGLAQEPQIDKLLNGVDILVATPGRMFDLIHQGYINVRYTSILVLDEADKMLDLGFIRDIETIVKFLPKNHQTLFFSATINPQIKKLAYSMVRNPIRIQISPEDTVTKNVEHAVIFINMDDKRFFLERIYKENPDIKIMVFARTRVRVERVHKAMERVGIPSLTIHGEKEQNERNTVLQAFKNNECKMLIATDVSARGIDVSGVDMVINYDLPDVAENYVHRIGRTGRGNAKGKALSFCSSEETEILAEIEEFIGKEISVMEMNQKDYIQTIDFSEDTNDNWRLLLKEAEKEEKEMNLKKKRKKK